MSTVTSFAADRDRRSAQADRWLAALLGAEPGAALVAVGGYGRRELLPGSDLDVLLLHDGVAGIAAIADRIWYPVWDSGAQLDHAVRTVAEARQAAAADLKVALGLLYARHVAGDTGLSRRVREATLADWRAGAATRLAELAELHAQRWARAGELAFLLEPDLKEAKGGLRDAHAIAAAAAAWVAPAAGPRVRAACETILDVRHALHEVTGRRCDRLVFQEQDEVAKVAGLPSGEALLRVLAGAARSVAYAVEHSFWQAGRGLATERRRRHPGPASRERSPAVFAWPERSPTARRPLADGVVEQDGEVVLARTAGPRADPVLVLRAAAAAAQAGLPLAPRALDRLAGCPPLPVPWPAAARDALLTLLGAGPAAVAVWEALDQHGLVTSLLPEWERVRNRPQRNPLHRYTVDRHLVETAARAAALTREVARPDLLLIAALVHDMGKGWPGDHSVAGAVVARDIARRIGLGPADAEVVAAAVQWHLLLPQTATRRDLGDPATVRRVAAAVRGRGLLELLHALAVADGQATGPAAWSDWKAGLVAELVRRVSAELAGEPPPQPATPRPEQLALITGDPAAGSGSGQGNGAVLVGGGEVAVAAPDRPGLLWQAAGVLAVHRLMVRSANVSTHQGTALAVLQAVPEYGEPPDPALVAGDLRRMLAGRLDVAGRLRRRARALAPAARWPAPPPKVTLLDDASAATVVEIRAHDEPGLLWRMGQALGGCGLDVRAARVETLGAEVVDVFYVVDGTGQPVRDPRLRGQIAARVLAALTG